MADISSLLQPVSHQNSLQNSQHQNIAAELLQAAAQASGEQNDSSGESGDDVVDDTAENGQKPEKRKKRSRACQSCRAMKIRCNPVEGQEACLACSKVNRQCVMPGPSRKRQKTVHKVAELEKKINALTQSLLSKTQTDPTPQQSPVVTDASRSAKESNKDSPDTRSSFPLFPKPDEQWAPTPSKSSITQYEDVIDRGIVSFVIADRIFNKFVEDLNPLCPLVSFPPGTTAAVVRRSRPMLFTAILAAGCITLVPEIQVELASEVARECARRIFYYFDKSLDLIQALLVYTTWVGKHRDAKDMGFNLYIHSAIVMAHDMGLTKRTKTPLSKDPVEQAELRRTWLACYWCGTCVAVTLRYQPMIRWSTYLEECLDFFATSPAALPTDQSLCALVKITHIMEDVATSFHMDDPASEVRIQDSSTQYSLKIFEKRIVDWKKECGKALQPELMKVIEGTASLYTHEIALHTNHNVDDFRPASHPNLMDVEEPTEDFITPSHLDAIAKCVISMKLALDSFITLFPTAPLRQLPCLSMVWVAYATVCGIRLSGALMATKSEYAEIFLPDLKIEYYLDTIIEKLTITSGTISSATCAPVSMFVQAFQKLKLWHQYRLAGAVPAEYQGMMDAKGGMHTVNDKIGKYLGNSNENSNINSASSVTPNTVITGDALGGSKANYAIPLQQQQAQMMGHGYPSMVNSQGFDTQGGSWLTNSNMPIDVSMFENQDWNFTLEDWNNFETSMVRPAGSGWLGYLL